MKITPKLPQLLLNLSILLVLFISACNGSGPSATPTPTLIPGGDLAKIASDIINKPTSVGQIKQTFAGDSHRRVVVFEELHSSLTGQVEIALMLNRLYERYQLRSIGLEGAFVGKQLDASWLRSSPSFHAYDDIQMREDVIVQMLEKGEISSSEMMALIYEDMKVAGIEDPNEYNSDTLTPGASTVLTVYLAKIAWQGMTPDQQAQANTLSGQAYVDYIIGTDAWAKQEYDSINDQTKILSFEEWLQILKEIEDKASSVQADITTDDQANLQALRNFYNLADQRSKTMVTNTLDLLKSSSNGLVAMTIGAGHTKLVAQLLTNANVSFVVIAGNSLVNYTEKGQLSAEAYDRKASSPPLSVDASGMLGSFLDNRTKKPLSVLDQAWFQTQCAIFMLVDGLAHKVAAGQRPPDIFSQLPKIARVTINPDSFQMVGTDVVVSFNALDQNNRSVVIWVKAHIIAGKGQGEKLEERLQEAYGRVKDSLPPSEKITKPMKVRISSDVIAAFGRDKQPILEVNLEA